MVRYSRFILMGLGNLALFLQEYLNLQARVSAKAGGGGAGGGGGKNSSSFLKSSTTTLLHNLNQAEKSSYVAHINTYLREDPFLRKYLPIDPSGNQLFDLIRDGVLLW
jgi:plastin-1